MQTVLVAGGAGFIGSHLCKSLLKDNYKVICVDNLLTGDKNNLVDLFGNNNFSFVEEDVAKLSETQLRIENLDYVFHLASPASPNEKSKRSYMAYPIETLLANSLGTYNLLKLTSKFNAGFLFASTSEIYGDPAISPQNEKYFGNVNPNGIRSVYDEGKRFGEAITFAYFRKYGTNTRIIRIFNTYGPLMQPDDGRVVSNFINQAIRSQPITVYGEGSQTRSFCYVDDMVLGIKKAMFLDRTKGEVFNLGNPQEKTILELAELIKKMTESSSEIIFEKLPQDDPKIRKPDISKAKEVLGWQPEIDIEIGLEKTINYFNKIHNL